MRFCSTLAACSGRPNTKYFFLTLRYFSSFVPIAQQAVQSAVLGRQSLSKVSLVSPKLYKSGEQNKYGGDRCWLAPGNPEKGKKRGNNSCLTIGKENGGPD
jgi:hypothetical protein